MDPYLDTSFKTFSDPVHGYISMTRLAVSIIDTSPFKRLERLHQLGSCFHVFRGATHTRFEHSLGTYHLAGRLTDCIRKRTPVGELNRWLSEIPELKSYYHRRMDKEAALFDNYVVELIKIAALCHDLGHGPLSHVFDDIFLRDLPDSHPMKHHEQRSIAIFKKIVGESRFISTIIHPDDQEFIGTLIDPPADRSGFVYQIVSNNLNGLDVDKYDYLMRDAHIIKPRMILDCERMISDVRLIDNVICYPRQAYMNVVELYRLRYRMHKQVYNHKTVVAIEYMLTDMMRFVDKPLGISKSVTDLDYFCELDEDFIRNVVKFTTMYQKTPDLEFVAARQLLTRIDQRKLYSHVGTLVTDTNKDKKEPFDLGRLSTLVDVSVEELNKVLIIHQNSVGYVSGDKQNPLEKIYYYDHKAIHNGAMPEKFLLDESRMTKLVPTCYREHVTMIFYTGLDKKFLQKLRNGFAEMTAVSSDSES